MRAGGSASFVYGMSNAAKIGLLIRPDPEQGTLTSAMHLYPLLALLLTATLCGHLCGAARAAQAADPIDAKWSQYLDSPPAAAVSLAAALEARADNVTASLLNAGAGSFNVSLGSFDVVCSGGGDLNAYYMGIEQVLSRLEARVPTMREHRHGGVSAGGWMSFENAVRKALLCLRMEADDNAHSTAT